MAEQLESIVIFIKMLLLFGGVFNYILPGLGSSL